MSEGPSHTSGTEPIGVRAASQNALRSARRLLRAKDRRETGRYLAEGPQAVREAIRAGRTERVFATAAAWQTQDDFDQPDVQLERLLVTDAELRQLTDTVHPQGVVAVCARPVVELDDLFTADPRLLVFCAEIRDPGNLGTVIRCADAFAAAAVLVGADSVDPYNPKAVRASTGSLVHLPVAVGADLADCVERARRAGLQVFGAAGGGAESLAALARSGDLARPTLWVLGNEAHGLSPEQAGLVDRLVAVPTPGRAESLNLSTAAAIVLYASSVAQTAP